MELSAKTAAAEGLGGALAEGSGGAPAEGSGGALAEGSGGAPAEVLPEEAAPLPAAGAVAVPPNAQRLGIAAAAAEGSGGAPAEVLPEEAAPLPAAGAVDVLEASESTWQQLGFSVKAVTRYTEAEACGMERAALAEAGNKGAQTAAGLVKFGEGGFGTVTAGVVNGTWVAIKRYKHRHQAPSDAVFKYVCANVMASTCVSPYLTPLRAGRCARSRRRGDRACYTGRSA